MPVTRRTALALGGALALPRLTGAQAAWPTGPVRYVNVFPPGGGTDILSRLWCAKMGEISGQQFVVENRAGSGGTVGQAVIARAAPDGTTVGLGSVSSLGIAPTLYASLPYDPVRDFTFIGGIWQLPNLLVVHPSVPARTVPELIALLKANPGQYTYASSGAGTTVHLSGEMLKYLASVDIVHVPYRGGAPAHVDLMAGRVHMIFDNIPQALQEAREGRVRALAVTSARRHPDLPDIPAMAEFLPGFEITSWGGLVGPAGLPEAMVRRASALSRQALESPDLIARFRENGSTAWWTTPADFLAFRSAQEAAFAPLVRASGARVE